MRVELECKRCGSSVYLQEPQEHCPGIAICRRCGAHKELVETVAATIDMPEPSWADNKVARVMAVLRKPSDNENIFALRHEAQMLVARCFYEEVAESRRDGGAGEE